MSSSSETDADTAKHIGRIEAHFAQHPRDASGQIVDEYERCCYEEALEWARGGDHARPLYLPAHVPLLVADLGYTFKDREIAEVDALVAEEYQRVYGKPPMTKERYGGTAGARVCERG